VILKTLIWAKVMTTQLSDLQHFDGSVFDLIPYSSLQNARNSMKNAPACAMKFTHVAGSPRVPKD
jgi:hypothetical protein